MSTNTGAKRAVQGGTRARASVQADADESASRRDGSDATSANQTRKGTVRLSLDVSVELNELVNQLAKDTSSTKSDVLRRAVTLLSIAVDARRQGKKIGIAERDQPLTTEIIWL